eukprot:2661328-Rhodomonas_salina.3
MAKVEVRSIRISRTSQRTIRYPSTAHRTARESQHTLSQYCTDRKGNGTRCAAMLLTGAEDQEGGSVSYTHLTLPTICSV